MIKFSRKTEYALIAIRHIANKGIVDYSTAKEISEMNNIPYEILAKILQMLSKNGIIKSTQGVKGGYKFLKSPDDVSLSEIILSLNEGYNLTRCLEKTKDKLRCCEISECCTIKSPIHRVQNRLNSLFEEITVRELL